MENNSHFDSFELQFTPLAQSFLKEAGKWARFVSIVGFIFIGLYVILALFMFAMGSAIDSAAGNMGSRGAFGAISGAFLGVIYLIVAIIAFFPTLYLSKFAGKAKLALENNNTEYLTNSIENLKSYFKFMGIVTIIMIAFFIIGFIVAIVGGIAAASATGSM
jgi:hypothetical protein